MAHRANKTEHNGPKRGCGAYYGRKKEAKLDSNIKRRRDAKSDIRAAINELPGA